MGIAEIRDAFEAYASGKISEFDLRRALHDAIQAQPDAVPMYVAMAAALRRRRLISADLEAVVISDLQAFTASDIQDPTRARANEAAEPFITPAETFEQDAGPQIGDISEPLPASLESEPSEPLSNTGSRNGRGTGPGSAWDTEEKLAEPEAQVTIGLVLRERFELVEELGRGGMGVVYKALDQREVENRGREPYVAIKVLNEEFKRHPESARALQRESKKAMRLAHPNIVLVRDFDRHHGNVYMVMELLRGQPLDQLLLNHFPRGMPIGTVVDIVTGLGAALSYAHQQGIVHADFKPSNAFLTDQNVVKVLDFGVARAALALDRGDSTLFDVGKLNAVSPAYASVEMLVGGSPDARDDIYALACVTYLLLSGRHPFNGIDAVKARDARLAPLPIKGIADHQWQALRSALVFERWERTASVKEFVSQFCSGHTNRAAKLAGAAVRATKLAGAAVRASNLPDAAVSNPWLIAAPAGALLAVAIALLLPRLHSVHSTPQAPAVAEIAAASDSPATPAQSSPGVAQLQQRLALLDPAAPDFTDQMLAKSADMKALIALAPGDDGVRRLQSALQAAMANKVKVMLANGDLAGARKLVSKLADLLPPGALRSYSPDALGRRQDLARLLSAPEATQHWADQVSAAMRKLSVLMSTDDPLLKEARDTSDRTFKSAADDAMAQQRLAEARNDVLLGLSVNPQSPGLSRAQADIASAQPVAEAAKSTAQPGAGQANAAQPDAVARLKQQLTQQAAAGDIDGATKTANALRNATAGTAYAVNDLPQQLIDSYAQQARKQLVDGSPGMALQTIAAGRKKFAGASSLKSMEVTYDRVEEEVERINMAPSLSVKDHQAWIAEIRQLAGEDFPGIEQMLAHTLANDIADQRARADRPSVVASLLDSGRKLFPEYSSVLEHGTAGVLDPAQILVSEEPLEPGSASASAEVPASAKAPASANLNVSASAENHALPPPSAQ